jgi:hypothetical protein
MTGMRNVSPGHRPRPYARRRDVPVDRWGWLYDDPYWQMTGTDPRQDELDLLAVEQELAERCDEYADRDFRPIPQAAREAA